MYKYWKLQSITLMSRSPSPDSQYLQNVELFGDYMQSLKKNGNAEKFKIVEKIFFETYYECIEERMNSHDALQRAMRVTLCFLIVSKM